MKVCGLLMNQFSGSLKLAVLYLLALAVCLGALVFGYLQPAIDFQDPSAARIVALHVPMAWLATVFFIISAVYAVRYLASRELLEDESAAAAAEIGLLFCVLATVTGSVFAHTQWHSWWNWDPRETSIFFLFLIYAAYFALRGSVDDPGRRALFSSVYDILACITMPFLIFVVPRMMDSLHPKHPTLEGSYWLVLLSTFFGFGALFVWLFRIRQAMARLQMEQGTDQNDDIEPLRPTLVHSPEA